MTTDHPISDPSWDYAQIWEMTHLAKGAIDAAIAYMMRVENASPESDQELRARLEWVRLHVEQALSPIPAHDPLALKANAHEQAIRKLLDEFPKLRDEQLYRRYLDVCPAFISFPTFLDYLESVAEEQDAL